MNKKPRIRQLLKIYNRVQGADLVIGFGAPPYSSKACVMVACFEYGRTISMESYEYCKSTAKKLRAKLPIPES